MRIVLSRKGYDSSYGGMPSPVFIDGNDKNWDGRMYSLPIPEVTKVGKDEYAESEYGISSGDLRYPRDFDVFCKYPKIGVEPRKVFKVHCDPDIRPEIYKTPPDRWKPSLGQDSQAASHLMEKNVCRGGEATLFLFFGLFQFCERDCKTGMWVKMKDSREFHAIWGYMFSWEHAILNSPRDKMKLDGGYSWHPHCDDRYIDVHNNNILFKGIKDTEDNGFAKKGYGVFKYNDILRLTIPGCPCRTHWRMDSLPWLDYDRKRSNMSYHDGENLFHEEGCHCRYFKAAERGQEFVVDKNVKIKGKVLDWLKNIMSCIEDRSWDGILQ